MTVESLINWRGESNFSNFFPVKKSGTVLGCQWLGRWERGGCPGKGNLGTRWQQAAWPALHPHCLGEGSSLEEPVHNQAYLVEHGHISTLVEVSTKHNQYKERKEMPFWKLV